MVEHTVCSSEEEEEEESNTVKSVSCTLESRRLDCAHERSEVPEIAGISIGNSPDHCKSRKTDNLGEAILETPDRETSRDVTTNGATTAITGRFSLFKWFKRGSRDSGSSWDRRERQKRPNRDKSVRDSSDLEENEIASELSSNGSVETLYSTATVRSFAFKSGNRLDPSDQDARRHLAEPSAIFQFTDGITPSVGPFGVGAFKVNAKSVSDNRDILEVTKTLPANVLSSRKRDITARYSLQSCNGPSSGFGSCANFGTRGNDCSLEKRTPSDNPRRAIRVHVRGKRRAPKPPVDAIIARKNGEDTARDARTKSRGKRRQAPKPPEGDFSRLKVSTNIADKDQEENSRVEAGAKSASASTNQDTGTESSSVNSKKTGSAIYPIDKEIDSAISPTQKKTENESPSTSISVKKETEGAFFRPKEETESEIFVAKVNTESATNPPKKEIAIAVALKKEKSKSSNLSARKEDAFAVAPIEKECTRNIRKDNIQNGNASLQPRTEVRPLDTSDEDKNTDLPERKKCENPTVESTCNEIHNGNGASRTKKKIASPKGMNVGEASVTDKVPENFKKGDKKDLACEKIDLSHISAENPPNKSNNLEKSQIVKTAAQKSTNFDTKNNDKIVEKIATSRFPGNYEDAANLDSGILGSTTIGEKAESTDLAGSISNDSLVLHGGVLHSRRETQAALTPGAAVVNALNPKINVSRSKGRITVTTGSQISTPAMPRPWYKRSVFEHSRDSGSSRRGDVLRNPPQTEVRYDHDVEPSNSSASVSKNRQGEDKNHEGGTLSRLNFFHKSEKTVEEKRKENKRKSGISLLANISELDKEAAAIVQEEQARTRAATSVLLQASRPCDEKYRNDETVDIVQEMVTSAMETSPKRGTRALISKFNAIGNITKVTVNTSFFAKNPSRVDSKFEKNEATRNSRDDWQNKAEFSKSENIVRANKDLSRYFLPVQQNTKKKKDDVAAVSSCEISSPNSSNDLSARLSFFQSLALDEKKSVDSGIRESTIEAKISRLNEQIFLKSEKQLDNSPKFSRLRINVFNEESAKPRRNVINEKTRQSLFTDGTEGVNVDKRNSEIVEKQFSNVFHEFHEKSASKEFNAENLKNLTKKPESSSQVSKVLEILVEAEKNDRQRANYSKSQVHAQFTESSDRGDSRSRVVSSNKPIENPMKTDLREMLKEMKHSLPKRPKSKKSCEQETSTKSDENTSKPDVKEGCVSMNDKRKEFFLMDTKKAPLLSPAKITYPPIIRIGPLRDDNVEKNVSRPNEEREHDRHKVSSSAQTSGNLRKITDQELDKSAKWRNEDMIYRTSGKRIATPGSSGLTKNTFQLIRPREFAQIEAIKTMKNLNAEANTYANVMEQSLYANAIVRPINKNIPESPRDMKRKIHLMEEKKLRDHGKEIADVQIMDSKVAEPQNMNTLAVNRLLRKLEAAIASGHHQQAAGLAKELATLKIHCSVVRQRTKAKDVVNVNMYIEDKLAHQGPIPIRLTRSMTIAQLKAKVFTEFEIPIHVQRWIVGKNLADDDSTTLEDLQTVEGSSVFLYLVAPEIKTDDRPLQDEKEVLAETPKDAEQINEIPELVNVNESEELPVESQTIKEEDDEECITEEVRMERYEALISLENCDVIPNSEAIECPICFVTYGPQEGVILRDCLHMFCKSCIANTVRYCEEAEVKCPYRDTEYTCESTLQEREIKALVEPEVYQQHLAKSIAQAENNAGNNAFHCKTPDCPGWCIYDDNVNNFLCPVCGVNNCLTCQVVHAGKNCRQYQEELRFSKETDQESKRTAAMLEEMVDRGEALPCPTCAVVLMKKWGCDWLRCSMCKTEICWVTRGPRWGPGGKGDTSGGCRCGENGIKCHPRCNYCH